MNVSAFSRSLDQELVALVRGVSFECLVCGEFVLHARRVLACPECGSTVADGAQAAELPPEARALHEG